MQRKGNMINEHDINDLASEPNSNPLDKPKGYQYELFPELTPVITTLMYSVEEIGEALDRGLDLLLGTEEAENDV